jgi:hypothetical protein
MKTFAEIKQAMGNGRFELYKWKDNIPSLYLKMSATNPGLAIVSEWCEEYNCGIFHTNGFDGFDRDEEMQSLIEKIN